MNQLDWEKMREDIAIVDVTSIISGNWSYNPSGYALGGSTSWVSGSVSNLTLNDGVYMTFRSYYSGIDTSDFVDNNTFDVDFLADKGTHSNFTAQKYGPDLINDTLTEEDTGSASSDNNVDSEIVTHGSTTGISGAQTTDSTTENMTEGSSTFGKTTVGGSTEDWETSAYKHVCRFELTVAGDVESISWYGRKSGGGGSFDAYGIIYDDSSGALNALKGTTTSTTVTTTAQWYTFTFSSAVSLSAGYYWIGIIFPGIGGGDRPIAYYDAGAGNQEAFNADSYPPNDPFGTPTYHDHEVSVYATYTATANYQLEIEHVVNSIVNYQNYNLTVRAYRSAENFYLQMYNFSSSSWANFSTVTASSLTWYNTTFAKADFVNATDQARIRYWQGVDATQETLYVDYSGVYGWNSTNYELDLEVQWTSVDYDETNEYLCIYGGIMGSENVTVDVWNGTAWNNVFDDLSSGWNNVSVSSYLTSSNFTIRFKGGNETGDDTQDSWDIDVTLLHVWSDEYILEVEFTGSSNTEDWGQLDWTVNSAWAISSVNVTLQLYNYTLGGYPTSGSGYIAYSSHDTQNTDENKSQTINVNPTHFRNATGHWKMKVKGVKATDTQFDFKADWIEFKVLKNGGTLFTFKNEGSLTFHLVSLWVNNSTNHQRYDINVFVNSAETTTYLRADISLPEGQCTVKVVTERGNTAVYSGS